MKSKAAADFAFEIGDRKFGTVLADPPWRFDNRTGKVAPEHRRLSRYDTLSFGEIADLPVKDCLLDAAHCYLWVPNALLPHGFDVLKAWGFEYKTNIVWHKIRKDGGSDGRGVGFYFRNVTELVLFGIRGKGARTLTGQPAGQPETGAFAQTGRTVRNDRGVQLGAVSGTVRPGKAGRLDSLGPSGCR